MHRILFKNLHENPTQEELRIFTANMPNALKTQYNNFSIQTRVTSRSTESTFFSSDTEIGQKTISFTEYDRLSKIQEKYITTKEMILINGNIGIDKGFMSSAQLLIEKDNANIAAMQQQLFFPYTKIDEDTLRIIYTPNLFIEGYSKGCVILVDIDSNITRVIGSDYFGESKKGGLRLWSKSIYDKGGLALHAGCKIFPKIDGSEKLALIIGLSGTGKTTMTFCPQLDSLPVQDDFCALMPGGSVHASENGCFAKTYDLDPNKESTIYNALTQPNAWLENVYVDINGNVDFVNNSYTSNGRGTFSLDNIPHRNPVNLPPVSVIIILNRNFDIIPAVVKLKLDQAAAFFMLGETSGTSAGEPAEEGKFLRKPGTNPFFFSFDDLQGNRFFDLLSTIDNVGVFIFNTGRVGGQEQDPRSKKVKISDSSKILEAVLSNNIIWKEDDDFGYFIAEGIDGISNQDILHPKNIYKKQKREKEYKTKVHSIKKQRRNYLKRHAQLYTSIKEAI